MSADSSSTEAHATDQMLYALGLGVESIRGELAEARQRISQLESQLGLEDIDRQIALARESVDKFRQEWTS